MVVYLDNNGTTPMCNIAKQTYVKWCKNPSNPSSSSMYGVKAKELLEKSIKVLKKHTNTDKYEILFTSGATEANCTIIRSVVNSWWKQVRNKPHIVISAIEHVSILNCVNQLIDENRITASFIKPLKDGLITPENVEKEIKKNTCLVSVMMANNEIGTINPVKEIADVAHKHKVPFHSDLTQIFGKQKLNIVKLGIDAFSMSFHKMYGPTGLGCLGISKELIEGYDLHGIMNGKQQNGLRAGTEPIPLVAAGIAAFVDNFNKRSEKNKKLLTLRAQTIKILSKCFTHLKSLRDECKGIGFYVLGNKNTLPNTLLCSFIVQNKRLCNIKLKKWLESKKIIVGIGSACNTSSSKASHVIQELDLPDIAKRGILRISFGDQNTKKDVEHLCSEVQCALSGKKDVYL